MTLSKGLEEVKEQDIPTGNFQNRKHSKYKNPEAGICLSAPRTAKRPEWQNGEGKDREEEGGRGTILVKLLL